MSESESYTMGILMMMKNLLKQNKQLSPVLLLASQQVTIIMTRHRRRGKWGKVISKISSKLLYRAKAGENGVIFIKRSLDNTTGKDGDGMYTTYKIRPRNI